MIPDRDTVILDGGLATELEARGADLHDPLWSARVLLDRPALIREVHDAYFEAGADVATAATYQATFEGLARRGHSRADSTRLLHSAVRLALDARDALPHRARLAVAASIGSYGAFLADGSEYRGDYPLTETQLADWHRPRVEVLAGSGADLLACETIPSLREARALADVISALRSAPPAWISFSLRDPEHTARGNALADCARLLDGYDGISAIGINCCAPSWVERAIRALRTGTLKPIVVYPNSGETYVGASQSWSGTRDLEALAERAQDWQRAGATWMGGCCRTTPEQIRALVARLRNQPLSTRSDPDTTP